MSSQSQSQSPSPVIPTPTQTTISVSRFQLMKATIRNAYTRNVIITKFLQSQQGVPRITARQKALDLGLSVNTSKARRCPQSHVSVIPLPVIVQDVVDDRSFNGVPIIKAPVARRPDQMGQTVVGAVVLPFRPTAPTTLLHRPLVQRPAPVDVPMDESEGDDDEDDDDEIEDTSGSASSLESVGLSPMTGCTTVSSSTSASSGSSGPTTPEDSYTPVVLRVKRRSADSSVMDYSFEKRPRYDTNVLRVGAPNPGGNRF